MSLRDVGLFLRARVTRTVTRFNHRHVAPLVPAPIEPLFQITGDPLALVALLEGRTNDEREAAVARWLDIRGVAFTRHRFERAEGRGENYGVEIGAGPRVLVLIAHHDAVPGSPGANDNAVAVAILLTLLERLAPKPPRRIRVRLLFTAAEELGYLGARAYVADTPVDDVLGVLSLELCGIGDSLVVWDAGDDTPFLGRVRRAFEGMGLRADEGYHVVGRIPVFGSDHRAFAPVVPAYGLTVVPVAQAEALRSFVFKPVRSALRAIVRRPVPFHTYHTPGDAGTTLHAGALDLTRRGLEAVIAELDR
ncbi:MAG: M20/M25/M40 family metallo-hydrolase [Candidatus Rokubacteria bacterium]|nr:M20/M25/M40 family metallo-hydrolase [Candidatus Rokubacteria bacterium]